jgi:hypothetical protein
MALAQQIVQQGAVDVPAGNHGHFSATGNPRQGGHLGRPGAFRDDAVIREEIDNRATNFSFGLARELRARPRLRH